MGHFLGGHRARNEGVVAGGVRACSSELAANHTSRRSELASAGELGARTAQRSAEQPSGAGRGSVLCPCRSPRQTMRMMRSARSRPGPCRQWGRRAAWARAAGRSRGAGPRPRKVDQPTPGSPAPMFAPAFKTLPGPPLHSHIVFHWWSTACQALGRRGPESKHAKKCESVAVIRPQRRNGAAEHVPKGGLGPVWGSVSLGSDS